MQYKMFMIPSVIPRKEKVGFFFSLSEILPAKSIRKSYFKGKKRQVLWQHWLRNIQGTIPLWYISNLLPWTTWSLSLWSPRTYVYKYSWSLLPFLKREGRIFLSLDSVSFAEQHKRTGRIRLSVYRKRTPVLLTALIKNMLRNSTR